MVHHEQLDSSQPPDQQPTRWMTSQLNQSTISPWVIGGSYRIDVSESKNDVEWGDPHCHPQQQWCEPDYDLMLQHHEWYKVTLTTPDGATHELRPIDGSGIYSGNREYLLRYDWSTPKTTNTTMRYYSYDGSYLWAAIQPFVGTTPLNWDIYTNDGTHIQNRSGTGANSGQFIFDTNGNSIRIYGTATGAVNTTHFVDQRTGREIRYVFDPAPNQGWGQGKVEYKAVEGNTWISILINFRATTVRGWSYFTSDQPCGSSAELINQGQQDFTVVDSIVLPETETGVTRQFSFEYNSDTSFTTSYQYTDQSCIYHNVNSISRGLGYLSKMTTPSGAQASYSYSLDIPPPQQGQNAVAGVLDAVDFPGEKLNKKELTHDGVTDAWNYGIAGAGFGLSRVDSVFDGSFVVEKHYSHDPALSFGHGADGKGGLAYSTNQSDKVLIERKWKFNTANGASAGSTGSSQLVPFNPVVDIEFTTLMDPPGTALKMFARKFQYDLNGNVTSETDYDWFSPTDSGLMRDSVYNVPTQVPSSAQKLRTTASTYHNPTSNTQNIYYNRVNGSPPTPLLLNAVKETTVTSPSNVVLAKTQIHYDSNNTDAGFDTVPTVGNVTKVRQDKDGTFINTVHTYDTYGNVLTTTDPKGNTTTLVYDTTTHAQPISVTVDPNPDPLVTGDELTTTTEYDSFTGLVKKVTDPNGNEATTSYDNQLKSTPGNPIKDPFGRPGLVTDPLGRNVKTFYHDNARQVETKADLKTVDDGLLNTMITHDRLGRAVKAESSEDTTAYTLISDTVYEKMGRIVYTRNPHRSANASTDGWTRTKKDELGRVVEVATFDGATIPSENASTWNGRVQTSYNAEQTTVTDQAGKQRKSVVDGLGRLKTVFEDPGDTNQGKLNFETDYTYDALGNLLQVDQGSQHRFFTYDSLSRLKTAKNPEQVNGSTQIATTYDYDDASNLITKSGPNSNTSVSFTYDGLNRVKTKTLIKSSVSTIWDYTYDTLGSTLNGKGRLTSVVLHNSSDGYYYDSYDKMGQVTASRQVTTAGIANSYMMSYQYDLAGNMTQETYPSGKTFVTEYDNAGRVAGIKRGTSYYAGASPTDAANRIQYAPHGAIGALKLGNGKWERTLFNGRLQPTEIDLGASNGASDLLKLEYSYGSTTNNGNVLTQTITAPKTAGGSLVLIQNYSYDVLNRLNIAEEFISATSQWKQTYDIDRWGNRAVRSTSYILPQNINLTPQSVSSTDFSAFNQNTNRIAIAGFGFDFAGNLTADPTTGTNGNGMVYDAENHQTGYTKAGATTSYTYDGDGHRVKRTDPDTTTTIFVYNAGGQLIAEYTSGTPPGGGTSYLTSDHLGSTRVVTDSTGGVKARYDYLPYGEEVGSDHGSRSSVTGYESSDKTRQKFTQKERDNESGLDYFLARYYSSAQGRFTSPDPLLSSGTINDPRTWNRYSYTLNNPLKYVDPFGLFVWSTSLGGNVSDDELRRRAGDHRDARRDANRTIDRRNAFRNALSAAGRARDALPAGADRDLVSGAVASYGAEGTANGVSVGTGQLAAGVAAEARTAAFPFDQNTNTFSAQVEVVLNERGGGNLAVAVAHEGRHVADAQEFAGAITQDVQQNGPSSTLAIMGNTNRTRYEREVRGYTVTSLVAQGLGLDNLSVGRREMWNRGWREADRANLRSRAIENHLRESPTYNLTPQNQGPRFIPR
jgi:RHS repeat-associated protein